METWQGVLLILGSGSEQIFISQRISRLTGSLWTQHYSYPAGHMWSSSIQANLESVGSPVELKGNPLTYPSLIKWGLSRKRRENLSVKAGQSGFLVSFLRPSSPVCWTLLSLAGFEVSGRKVSTAHRDWAKVTRAQPTLPGILQEETVRNKEARWLEQK